MKHQLALRRLVAAIAASFLALSSLVTLALTLPAAAAVTVSFGYTGSAQSWAVPAGVTSVTIDMAGGAGSPATSTIFGSGLPGNGGRVQCTMSVVAGDTVDVYVAGGSGNYWGYSSGGDQTVPSPISGGGSSAVLDNGSLIVCPTVDLAHGAYDHNAGYCEALILVECSQQATAE